MLLIAILGLGLFAGAFAQIILGSGVEGVDWRRAIVAGLAGSFVGGMLFSLLAGDGLRLRPSGLLGSIFGAIIVTALDGWYRAGRSHRAR
jgi:uncharacterized membrane protein YeaQ/YmgE (transglycosylase-associated protein family)